MPNQPEPRKPLCPNAWAIPPSPRMLKNNNGYYTCSLCSEPCDVIDLKEDVQPEAWLRRQVWSSIDEFGTDGATNRVMALFQADKEAAVREAKVDAIQLYMDTCEKEGVPPSWRNIRAFQKGQILANTELTHPQAGEGEPNDK